MPFDRLFARLLCALWLLPALAGAEAIRLGDDVVPTSEALLLRLDASQADYSGSARIALNARKEAQSFRFHSEGLTLTRLALTDAAGADVAATREAVDEQVVEVRPAAPLPPGAYTLEVDFTNDFDTTASSLYRMEKDGVGYAFTDFEPNDAREAFPCWDEPEFKIPFQITVEVPEGQLAVSNYPVAKTTTESGKTTFEFQETPPMPTYLVAMAAGPLETVPIVGLSVPGRVVTVQGQSHLAGLAVEITPGILKALEEYFGRPYPFAKLDLLAIPEYGGGAMENVGAVTFRDNILLMERETASVGARSSQFRVLTHELAHMWFGDLVTLRWWDDLWLNESFADWLEAKVTAKLHPELDSALSEVRDTHYILGVDAMATTKAIRQPIGAAEEVFQDMQLAYTKGRSVLGMFESWVGSDVFRRGVIDYLAAHEWSNATASDLWQALDAASGKPFSAAMTGFLEQPGFPRIDVELLDDGRVRLHQERFRNFGTTSPDHTWALPVVLRYPIDGTTATQTVFLRETSSTVELKGLTSAPAWIHPNAGAIGYYRWNLPVDTIRNLADAALEALSPEERVEMVGNVAALLAAGKIHGDEYLDVLGRFADDPEPLVLSTISGSLSSVRAAFVRDELEDLFAVYVRQTLEPALRRFGLEKTEGEAETVSMLRPSLYNWLGDLAKDPEVRRKAAEIAHAYMKDTASADPSLVGVSLSITARDGDQKMWDELRKRFETAATPTERSRYLSALGAFEDPTIVQEALSYALEGPVRPTEIFFVARTARDEEGRQRLFRWMTENYEAITSRLPPPFHAFMPNFAGGCSEEILAKAQSFFSQPEHSVPGTEEQLQKVTERVHDCIGLRKREGEAVTRYLHDAVELTRVERPRG